MLRFALDEMTSPAPADSRNSDPAAVFHHFGISPPMWAILNDAPTPDEHAQYQDLLAQAFQRRARAEESRMVNLAAETTSNAPALAVVQAAPENAASGISPSLNGIAQTTMQTINAGGRAPGLYVTGHRVGGFGPYHTAIEYVNENGTSQWVSAAPNLRHRQDWGLMVSGTGEAVRNSPESNCTGPRCSDWPGNNETLGRITPPAGEPAAAYFDDLRNMGTSAYHPTDYTLFPKTPGEYNSNSFTRGLIEATGGTTNAPYGRFIGGNTPLPPGHFNSPSNEAAGFPLSPAQLQLPPFFRRIP